MDRTAPICSRAPATTWTRFCAARSRPTSRSSTHCSGVVVKPILNFLENGFVLPSCDAAFSSCRALRFQRAGFAVACPIAAQRLSFLYVHTAISQPLAGGTAINIVGSDIDEVLFAEAASSFGTRSLRLRQYHGDAGLLAGLDLIAFMVATIGHRIERPNTHLGSRLLGHIRIKACPSSPGSF
jgi:hypothetical protein